MVAPKAGHHPESVSLAGAAWNLTWVTLGNIVGGAAFVAGAYHVSTYGLGWSGSRQSGAMEPKAE